MNKTNIKYSLDTTSKKHPCPACKKKRFVLYLDNETSQPLDSTVGRCDREQSCGYHLAPKEYFDKTGIRPDDWRKARKPMPPSPPQKPGRLPFKYVQTTLNRYDENLLIRWLSTLPGWNAELAERTARSYNVGTGSKGVNQWPIYWQVDTEGKARSGKLIKYDPATGKRIKDDDVYSYDWIHRILIRSGMLTDDETRWKLDQCLFGLHLIDTDKKKPIAIVEGEKTALIASQYIPAFTWLSSGQLNGLSEKKLMPLKGRNVVLFPDKGVYDEWKEKAELFKHIVSMKVSDLLEVKAPAEHDGYDLADYLINFDISTFKDSTVYQPATTPHPNGFNPYTGEIFDMRGYPASWDMIEPPEPDTPEYSEMIQAEYSDSDSPELDPKVSKITQLFDAVPI